MSWWAGKEIMKAYEKNRVQLNKRNSLKEKTDFGQKNSTKINFKKVSPERLEAVKQKLRQKRKKQNRRDLIIFSIIIVGILCLGYFFISNNF